MKNKTNPKRPKEQMQEEQANIPALLMDLAGQKMNVLAQLRYPPFTLVQNYNKTKKIFADMEKIEAKVAKNVMDEKVSSVKDSFMPLVTEHKKMFSEAKTWMAKSGNSEEKAAEMYRATPEYKPGDITAPVYQAGWVS